MSDEPRSPHDGLMASLTERAKELNCLYHVEEALRQGGESDETFMNLLRAIPPGWQYPDVCEARLTIEARTFSLSGSEPADGVLQADIVVQDEKIGALEVFYTDDRPSEDDGPFLKDEVRLINTIAGLIGHFVLRLRLQDLQKDWEALRSNGSETGAEIWRSPLHLLRESDRGLYLRIAHKMLNHLCQIGVGEAQQMLASGAGPEEAAGERASGQTGSGDE